MKKWGIFVLVVLGGLLLILQYFAGRRAQSISISSKSAQSEQTGAALPLSSTDYVEPGGAIGLGDAVGDGGGLILPKVPTNYQGACLGGSLEEMRLTHGTYWGSRVEEGSFDFGETQKMYDMMASYVGCVAVARENIALCDTLPAEVTQGKDKWDAASTPKYKCQELATNTLLLAYIAGNVKNSAYCRKTLSSWQPKDVARISVPDLCKAGAEGGMSGASDYLIKRMPPEVKGQINKSLPSSASSCGGDAKCLVTFQIYSAIKNGNVAGCPSSSDGYCEARITGNPASCENIVHEMSRNYCSYVERVKKVTGGFIGMSKEAIKAKVSPKQLSKEEAEKEALRQKLAKELKRQEADRLRNQAYLKKKEADRLRDEADRMKTAEKKEADRLRSEADLQKKENDKIQLELNSKVKKILSKN